jgi:hypothetical protein
VVLVRKSDGSLRMCIDFRTLSNRTVRDARSIHRMQETLDCLVGSKYFCRLDLRSDFNTKILQTPTFCCTKFYWSSLIIKLETISDDLDLSQLTKNGLRFNNHRFCSNEKLDCIDEEFKLQNSGILHFYPYIRILA